MKKVFYFLNTVPEWVDIVSKLDEIKDWKPVFWVTTEILQEKIAKCLPSTKIVDLQSHKRGEFDSVIYLDKNTILDKKIIKEYSYCEKIVLAMMNRMDPTRHSFNYHQRVQLYYRILIYWFYTFDKYQPDLIFFDETPHVPFEYIMHEVAIQKNIKIIRFNPTHINDRLLIFGTVNKTPNYMINQYEEMKYNDNNGELCQDMNSYYAKLKGTYKDATPYYMKKQPIKIKSIISRLFFILKRVVQNKSDSSYQRTYNGYVQDSKFMKFIKFYNRMVGRFYKNKLLKTYNSLVTSNLTLSTHYIYVPLHFQPERTSSPDGDFYENQWLMIQLLAQTIPKGWKLYVKEHISQFRKDFSGEMGRNLEFYQELLLFENVQLVPLDVSSYDLIDNSQFTATISGTVGLESVVRDKRVLLFGHPWFEICEGVSSIKNKEDLDRFFEEVMGSTINQEHVKTFFKLIENISLSGNHSGNMWNSNFNKEQNINNLVKLIVNYSDKID